MKKSSTKGALFTSALALLLCFVMLLGTTFAWFTDEVTSTNNKIQAGTLEIDMLVKDVDEADSEYKSVKADKSAIFNYTNWEPGYIEPKHVKVDTDGSLALKYTLKIVPIGDVEILADVIDVYYAPSQVALPDRSLAGLTRVGTLREVIAGMNGLIINDQLIPEAAATTLGKTANTEDFATIALKMVESAGNEYQGKKIGTTFDINLFATQFTYEEDSFDNMYDEDAPFGEYVEIDTTADLLATLASAEANQVIAIKLNGDVEWATDDHHGENDITPASEIIIDGNGYTITATGSGVTPIGDVSAPMTIKNAKIVDNSVSYKESAWELSYLELGGRELVCVNVDFADPIQVVSDKATFTNCSFVGHYDKNSTTTTQYGAWLYNGDSTFTNCSFTGTRAMKICDQYAGEVGTVVIDGCTFDSISEKPGIAIDDHDTLDMNITIKNSTFIDCQAGDQGLYVYETDNTVPTVENNSVLFSLDEGLSEDENGNLFISSAEGLQAAKDFMDNNSSKKFWGKTYTLTADIDATSVTWNTKHLSPDSSTANGITFDGKGHTISNLIINGQGLFTGATKGGNSTVVSTFKNITFDNVTVTGGSHHNGVVWGEAYGSLTLENVNVINSKVSGGCNVGGLIGRNSESHATFTFKDCSVKNTIVEATTVADYSGASAFLGMALRIGTSCSANVVFEGTNVSEGNTLTTAKGMQGGGIYTKAEWEDPTWENPVVVSDFTNYNINI